TVTGSPTRTFSGAVALSNSFGSCTWTCTADRPLKLTVAWQVQRPLTSGNSCRSMRFSCAGCKVPRSQASVPPAADGFGSADSSLPPAGTRLRTTVCSTAAALTFLTTIWKVAGWPSLIAGGPTHSMLTAGSCRPVGLSSGSASAGAACPGGFAPAPPHHGRGGPSGRGGLPDGALV